MSIFKRKHKEVSYKENRFIKKERKLFSVFIEIEPVMDKATGGYSIRYFEDYIPKEWESYLYRRNKDRIILKDKATAYKSLIELRADTKQSLHERLEKVLNQESEEVDFSYNPNKQGALSRSSLRSVGISARRESNYSYWLSA